MSQNSASRRPLLTAIGLALLVVLGMIALVQRGEIDRLTGTLADEARRFQTRELAAQEKIRVLVARLESLEEAAALAFSPETPVIGDPADAEEIERLRAELASLREDPLAALDVFPVTIEPLPAGEIRVTSFPFNSLPQSNPQAPSWSESQATGPPDTEGLGDFPSAWASKRPDGGEEWLEIGFADAVAPSAIVIVETFNPGAVTRVEGRVGNGAWRRIWSGRDPSTEEANEFVIAMNGVTTIDTVKITLDTTLVSGWNEIDAVGLEVGDETLWGNRATASSTYAR